MEAGDAAGAHSLWERHLREAEDYLWGATRAGPCRSPRLSVCHISTISCTIQPWLTRAGAARHRRRRGIRAEIARQLASNGVRVAVTDLDEQAAHSTAKELQDRHGAGAALAVGSRHSPDLSRIAIAVACVESALGPMASW